MLRKHRTISVVTFALVFVMPWFVNPVKLRGGHNGLMISPDVATWLGIKGKKQGLSGTTGSDPPSMLKSCPKGAPKPCGSGPHGNKNKGDLKKNEREAMAGAAMALTKKIEDQMIKSQEKAVEKKNMKKRDSDGANDNKNRKKILVESLSKKKAEKRKRDAEKISSSETEADNDKIRTTSETNSGREVSDGEAKANALPFQNEAATQLKKTELENPGSPKESEVTKGSKVSRLSNDRSGQGGTDASREVTDRASKANRDAEKTLSPETEAGIDEIGTTSETKSGREVSDDEEATQLKESELVNPGSLKESEPGNNKLPFLDNGEVPKLENIHCPKGRPKCISSKSVKSHGGPWLRQSPQEPSGNASLWGHFANQSRLEISDGQSIGNNENAIRKTGSIYKSSSDRIVLDAISAVGGVHSLGSLEKSRTLHDVVGPVGDEFDDGYPTLSTTPNAGKVTRSIFPRTMEKRNLDRTNDGFENSPEGDYQEGVKGINNDHMQTEWQASPENPMYTG